VPGIGRLKHGFLRAKLPQSFCPRLLNFNLSAILNVRCLTYRATGFGCFFFFRKSENLRSSVEVGHGYKVVRGEWTVDQPAPLRFLEWSYSFRARIVCYVSTSIPFLEIFRTSECLPQIFLTRPGVAAIGYADHRMLQLKPQRSCLLCLFRQ